MVATVTYDCVNLNKIKNSVCQLHYSHISGAHQPPVANGYHVGQHRHKKFPSLEKILLAIAAVERQEEAKLDVGIKAITWTPFSIRFLFGSGF